MSARIKCGHCERSFTSAQGVADHQRVKHGVRADQPMEVECEPDHEGACSVCGSSPVHPITGMCGPCTFGEADTVGGNW